MNKYNFNGLNRSVVRFFRFKVLHANDSAERIALGAAIGLFVAWSPFLGLHLVLALLLSAVFKANKLIACLFVWLQNPFTMVLIYHPAYLLGRAVTSVFHAQQFYDRSQFINILKETASFQNLFTAFYKAEFWRHLVVVFSRIGVELFVGGAIIGFFVACVGYLTVYKVVTFHREKKPHRRFAKYRNQ